MKIEFTKPAEKQSKKLPKNIREKFKKQLVLLLHSPHHPSLHIKKMTSDNRWEGRIDYRYRFSFCWHDDCVTITAVGMHDSGLGKK